MTLSTFLTRNKTTFIDFSLFLASTAAMLYAVKWVLDSTSPTSSSKKAKLTPKQLTALSSSLPSTLSPASLTPHELTICTSLIHPSDIQTTFSSIAGLDNTISSLRESVIYPLLHPQLFSSSSAGLIGPPKGVLLYGPPGCGKTLLAKALAKESGASFLNISPSLLTSKWFGESNKLVSALFSLAHKIQPCIIFIDEIDCFLRSRDGGGSGGGEHEAMGMVKSEFMTLWDGLLSNPSQDRVMILGATNRPQDIDPAILRRMPKRYSIPLPSSTQRVKLLQLMLEGLKLASDVDVHKLAQDGGILDGLSGSAIREVCRNAALQPIREHLRSLPDPHTHVADEKEEITMRPITLRDFLAGEEEYLTQENNSSNGSDPLLLD